MGPANYSVQQANFFNISLHDKFRAKGMILIHRQKNTLSRTTSSCPTTTNYPSSAAFSALLTASDRDNSDPPPPRPSDVDNPRRCAPSRRTRSTVPRPSSVPPPTREGPFKLRPHPPVVEVAVVSQEPGQSVDVPLVVVPDRAVHRPPHVVHAPLEHERRRYGALEAEDVVGRYPAVLGVDAEGAVEARPPRSAAGEVLGETAAAVRRRASVRIDVFFFRPPVFVRACALGEKVRMMLGRGRMESFHGSFRTSEGWSRAPPRVRRVIRKLTRSTCRLRTRGRRPCTSRASSVSSP
ncbi:hypothetical protein THAOC_15814 [Thalassiosira oceanica]|uniref:Uncharacterized protein n=1 Tax=Thalassiosira oceanica TaxID=159749 RepID=K0SZ52_THAOC|nr:hypothetical protein THAOC_15814 [Thalassiosira oceanica]|eukprot:EJK63522.1 hypothetical protein THAOC_15814 [Thalassiosira oceanica]